MTTATFDKPLSATAMRQEMTAIMHGERTPEAIKTFLESLARRGETAEEIAVAAQVLREQAVKLPLRTPEGLTDTCGTGGDGQGTVNISTLAALVAAGAGARIAKHGNRAASSRCGSADVLEALGVNLAATPEQVARCIDEVGFGFCFAPAFHPAMKTVAPVRKALGIRTIFNLIGPLANPAPLAYQIVGVSEPRLLRVVGEALVQLGIRHGFVLHGQGGLDEATTTGLTEVVEVQGGGLKATRWDASTWGLGRAQVSDLKGGDAPHNARIAQELLEGARTPVRDVVLLNAAAALVACGQAPDMPDALARAGQAIETGRAREVLRRVQELTR